MNNIQGESRIMDLIITLNIGLLYIDPNKIRGATAPESQDRLKRLLPDDSTGGLVVSKALIPQP